MSSKNPPTGDGEGDPMHVGPPELILQKVVEPSEVPEDIRKRFEAITQAGAPRPIAPLPIAHGGIPAPARQGAARRANWSDVTFAGRALALVEGTNQPDCDDFGDPLVWVFAVSADHPVIGEKVVSVGAYSSSSAETRFSNDGPARRGKRASYFAAIRTEPRSV